MTTRRSGTFENRAPRLETARQLTASEERSRAQTELLEAILGSMEQGIAAFDTAGRLIASNDRYRRMLSLPGELCKAERHFLDLARYLAVRGDYGPGEPEALAQERWRAAAAGGGLDRAAIFGPGGSIIEITGRPMPGGGFVNTYTDVTADRAAESALRESEARFRLLAEHSGDVVALNSVEGVRLYISPACERVLGWRSEELTGRNNSEFVHPDDRKALRDAHLAHIAGERETSLCYRFKRPDGSWLWVEGHARSLPSPDGQTASTYVVVLRDASVQKAAELELTQALERMARMAITDGLTGLFNRGHLDEVANREWLRCARERVPFSVIMMDADRFKFFNDCYGHAAGDACLRAIAAELLVAARRPGDFAARYGGEEFALLMSGTGCEGALHVAERLCEAIQKLGIVHRENTPAAVVTVSLGVATALPGDAANPFLNIDSLFSASDKALYLAKSAGRNRVSAAVAESA